jgi:hypothetical protein
MSSKPSLDHKTNTAFDSDSEVPVRNRSWLPKCVVGFALILYVSLACWHIRYPGIYYDEAFFINAALGAKYSDSFVAYRLFGIPVMLMSYIGALKSFVWAPVFAVFGVSPLTIRLPAIIISAYSLLITYAVLVQFVPRILAALGLLLIAVDAPFVFQTRTDLGPIAIMIALKMTAIYVFMLWLKTGTWRYFAFGLFCLALGVYDKLTFLWFVVALCPAVLVYAKRIVYLLKLDYVPVVSSVLIYLGALAIFGFRIALPLLRKMPPVRSELMGDRFHFMLATFDQSLTGQLFSNVVFAREVQVGSFCPMWLVPVAFVTALSAFLILRRAKRVDEVAIRIFSGVTFFSVIFAVLFIEVLATPEAHGPHHVLIVWPFHYLSIILAISLMVMACRGLARTAASVSSAFIIMVWIGNNLASTAKVITAFSTVPLQSQWSNHIYDLNEFICGISPKLNMVICADWGLYNQLQALCPSIRTKCIDAWVLLTDADESKNARMAMAKLLSVKQGAVVVFAQGRYIIPKARENVFKIALENGISLNRLAVINDQLGPLYEVYLTARRSSNQSSGQ